MNLEWLHKIKSKWIHVAVAVLALVFAIQIFSAGPSGKLEINTTAKKVLDLRKWQGEDLVEVLRATSLEVPLLINWKTREQESLWIGNREKGKSYISAYLPGLDLPVLAFSTSTAGQPSFELLKKQLDTGRFYLKLVKRAASQLGEPREAHMVEKVSDFGPNVIEQEVINAFGNSLQIQFYPEFLFEVVGYSPDGARQAIVLSTANSQRELLLLAAGVIFLIYFVHTLLEYKFRPAIKLRSNTRGATLVEVTILASLISLVAIASITQLGKRTECDYYNAAGFVGGLNPYPTVELVLECCPGLSICFHEAEACNCAKLAVEM